MSESKNNFAHSTRFAWVYSNFSTRKGCCQPSEEYVVESKSLSCFVFCYRFRAREGRALASAFKRGLTFHIQEQGKKSPAAELMLHKQLNACHNETREYGNSCMSSILYFSPASGKRILHWDDSHIKQCTLYTHQTFQTQSFQMSSMWRRPVYQICLSVETWVSVSPSESRQRCFH